METVSSNIKRLVATDKKYHEAPVFIIPKEDPNTKQVIDYKSRIDESLRDQVTIDFKPKTDRDGNVTDEVVIRVDHLKIFDLTRANDALMFEVVKEDPMIAPSKEAVNPDRHRYYIEDREKEAKVTISKSRLKAKAFAVIESLSLEEMTNYARILGLYVRGLSGTQIESALYEHAEKDPQKVLDVGNDKDLKYKVFLRKLIDKGQVTMNNGKYMNGNEMMGVNEEYAILWLKDPANNRIVTQWNRIIETPESAYEPNIGSDDTISKQPEMAANDNNNTLENTDGNPGPSDEGSGDAGDKVDE